MTTTANYYRILNVSHDAALTEIHRAYRSLARDYHPDVAGAAGSAPMSLVNEAYQCLSNPSKRKRYDQVLKVREPSGLQLAALEAVEAMLETTGWRRTTLGNSYLLLECGYRRVATRLIPVLETQELDRWTRSSLGILRRQLADCAVVIAYRVLAAHEVESRIGDLRQPLTAIDLVESRAFGMEFADATYEELFRPLLIP